MAFIIGPALPSQRSSSTHTRSSTTPVCCQSGKPTTASVTRRQLLSNAAMAVTAALVSTMVPAPAFADGTGLERAFTKSLFPKKGFNVPDAVNPSADQVDRQILAKPEAKAALSKLREYSNGIDTLYDTFKNDSQAELAGPIRKLVNISALRNSLNVVNEAINEDTQLVTDKIVRGIIQDIGELQNAVILKSGVPRTTKKIDRTTDWFIKISGDFKRLLSFYN